VQGGVIVGLTDISMKFGSTPILNNVSLSVERGQSWVFVGPSGQGKSVLLKIMSGLLKPTAGRVDWEGREADKIPSRERVQMMRKMGMLFQKNALFDFLTVEDNVSFPLLETTDLDPTEIESRVAHFLEAVELDHCRKLYPHEISGGMQKRLGMARASALKPQVVFYDDPTAGLDPVTSRKVTELILSLKKELDSTIITITNDMNRAYQLAGTISMVVDCELITMGNEKETRSHADPRVNQFINGHLNGPLTSE